MSTNVVEQHLEHWLRLARANGVGPVTVARLLAHFDTIEAVFRASESALRNAGATAKLYQALHSAAQADGIASDLEWQADADDRTIIPLDSNRYPALLKQIASPPPVLYVRGDSDALHAPQLAIVGSRKPTSQAVRTTARLSAALVRRGLTICSGLAYGIDAQAHRSALDAGGLTIAVTGTGLDRVYPASHHALAHEVSANGALVSEFPIGTNPRPAYFPRRNRIISGLSFGTLVVEAALKSGSLTTAGHATEQSREVFAIPGSIDNPLARGCHALIRRGATLVETVDDIVEQLAPMLPSRLDIPGEMPAPATPSVDTSTDDSLSDELASLLMEFEFEPLSLDQLVDKTELDIATITRIITELELEGKIESNAAGEYIRLR